MKVISSALVVILVLTAFLLMSRGVFADHGGEHIQGMVILEPRPEETGNTPAPPGIEVFAFLGEKKNSCGEATTKEGGKYELALAIHCTKGTLGYAFVATGDVANTTVSLPSAKPDAELNIVFGALSFDLDRSMSASKVWEHLTEKQRDLRSQPAPPARPGGSDDLTQALQSLKETVGALRSVESTDKSLIDGQALVLLLGLIVSSAVFLLAIMVYGRLGQQQPSMEGLFRQQIEGLVLVLVVVAVIVLGVTEKIGDQGLVSILAAIAGYAVGRGTSGGGQQPAQPAPIAPVAPPAPIAPAEPVPPAG